MQLITLLVSILLGLNSFATNYRGVIARKKNRLIFKNYVDNKSYVLVPSNPLISTYLDKLSYGDYVSFDGLKDRSQQAELTVNALNYIGLKSLLGVWAGDDSYCYSFINFTEFTISPRLKKSKCAASFSPTHTYILSPTSNTWAILISGSQTSYIGDLKFENASTVQIELFDSETGAIIKTLRLKK